jgi:hypothetical protein
MIRRARINSYGIKPAYRCGDQETSESTGTEFESVPLGARFLFRKGNLKLYCHLVLPEET